jgi:hypothetical protein
MGHGSNFSRILICHATFFLPGYKTWDRLYSIELGRMHFFKLVKGNKKMDQQLDYVSPQTQSYNLASWATLVN